MINCLVVDDEPHASEVLEHYIGQTAQLRHVASCTSPLRALELLRQHPIDCIFLDIHMPEMTGLDFIRTIRNTYKVVLCTAYPEYALDGFELDVVDYLVKPIPLPRFMRTVEKLTSLVPVADDFILVRTGVRGNMLKIDVDDIRYVEARKNYVDIHHKGGHTLALLPLKDLEERLPADAFMRIQKSCIVAIREITAIEGNEVRLHDGATRILVGESYRARFFAAMKGRVLGRG
ncbi:MAG TPA: LytTR family DNA-binding domain-containing protein [Dinghuibacter sp.]|jgi:DNA-binding LytR/AlgR family response regulator|uniref:LytR/AlgR family response regulator transcription factor n=1 Tax=Dinghuibacter sp. TaxID=2024697 RepID=UPI002C4D9168|nr:LytTR family DNA-binding domain-containing protein [Dinghuibacter sp.]HTJ14596.1 LytTR family DNA-binding domain-containing protein [Dinghuibacter sp.]